MVDKSSSRFRICTAVTGGFSFGGHLGVDVDVADAVSAKTESKSEKSSTKGQLACKCEAEFQLLEHGGETITGRDLRS